MSLLRCVVATPTNPTELEDEDLMTDQLATLREKRQQALEGGGTQRIQAQHANGKLTARERIELLHA